MTYMNKLAIKMVGRTIQSLEIIKAEFGRSYAYICIVFTDGSKIMLMGGEPYNPDPTVEEMAKAPCYFSADDIAAKVRRDKLRKRAAAHTRENQERAQYERLKEKYG